LAFRGDYRMRASPAGERRDQMQISSHLDIDMSKQLGERIVRVRDRVLDGQKAMRPVFPQ
jgi:hypothetical protein